MEQQGYCGVQPRGQHLIYEVYASSTTGRPADMEPLDERDAEMVFGNLAPAFSGQFGQSSMFSFISRSMRPAGSITACLMR